MSAPATVDRASPAAPSAGLVAVLSLVMATTLSMGAVIGILAPFLVDDLSLSRAQIGALVAAFGVTDAFSGPPMGRLADRTEGRLSVLLVFAVVVVGLLALAAAPTFPLMLAATLLIGVAAGGANPSTNRVIVVHVPAGSRGTITGLKQSGVPAGTFVAGLALPSAAIAFGWRGALIAAAAVPLAGLLVSWRLVGPDPAAPDGAQPPASKDLPAAVRYLTVYGFLMGLGLAVVVGYLPLYAEEEVGMSAAMAGVVAAVAGLVGLAVRVYLARVAERHGSPRRVLIVVAVLAVLSMLLIWAAPGRSVALLWVGAGLAGATVISWTAPGMIAVMAAAHRSQAGRASGIVALGFALGLTVGAPAFGYSVDATGSYDLGFAVLSATLALAVLPMVAWTRRTREVGER